MKFSDGFYKLAGARWRLAKAIAMVESGGGTEDVDAEGISVGDSEDARGAWQLHAAFAMQFRPRPSTMPTEFWVIMRGVPQVAVLIVGYFLSFGEIGLQAIVRVATLPDLDAALAFHYGHLPAIDPSTGKRVDPDGYAAKIAAALESSSA